jgi:hypothetical protein
MLIVAIGRRSTFDVEKEDLVSLASIARSQPEVTKTSETLSNTRYAEEHRKSFRLFHCSMKPSIEFRP